MERLIENLTRQLKKVIKDHSSEVNSDTYWRGVKIGLETAIENAEIILNNKKMSYEKTIKWWKLEVITGYDENIQFFFRISKLHGIELALFNRLLTINCL